MPLEHPKPPWAQHLRAKGLLKKFFLLPLAWEESLVLMMPMQDRKGF
jgi:hypothetical protein